MTRSAPACQPLLRWLILSVLALALGLLGTGALAATPAKAQVIELQLDGVINPASSDFIVRGIERATEQKAQLVVITLDTPGGLDTSMRSIVKAILASPIPVATYVAPSGARAASAGTFILYASHIAAMSPASNIGAATPVQIGGAPESPAAARNEKTPSTPGASERKAQNDAAAYIRSLAQLRHRNGKFAEQAVLDAASMSAQEALKGGVIDMVAIDLPHLLKQLNGRQIKLDDGQAVELEMEGASVQHIAPDWRTQLLLLIANPQVAIILMMIGVYGLFYEVTSPGLAGPGVAGLISILLAFYAFQLLPVNWVGVGLICLGLSLMVAEVFLPSFGIAGAGGVAAFVLGGIFLTDTDIPGFDLGLPFLVGTGLLSLVVLFVIGRLALRAHRRRIVSGTNYMIGEEAIVTSIDSNMAYAEIHGEFWKIRSRVPLRPGQHVRIMSINGLTLEVEPIRPAPAGSRT